MSKITAIPLWDKARILGHCCRFEEAHAIEVVRLSTLLFDALQPLHGCGEKERDWLRCAALLHDIGWIYGRKDHNKASMQIIINAPFLTKRKNESVIIGLIARYHRKALPDQRHRYFKDLPHRYQRLVTQLAGILRLADGLDYAHKNKVQNLSVRDEKGVCQLHIKTQSPISIPETLKKVDLFKVAFNRNILLKKQ